MTVEGGVPETPKVTVIIPVYGASRTLERALASVAASDYPNFEMIAVDDGSPDASLEILHRFGARVLQISHAGSAAARNRAIEEADGEILYFTDADVEIFPETISRGVRHFVADPSLAAVFGSYTPQAGAPGFFTAYKNYVHHYTHQTGRSEAWTFWTGCGFVRRAVIQRLGGFDAGQRFLSDVEFGYRMNRAGERVRLDPEIQVVHMKHYTLTGVLRSDFFGRAVPWSRLILRYRAVQNDLNLGKKHILSVPIAGLTALALIASPFLGLPALGFAAAGFVALALLNRSFLGFVRGREGWGFWLRALLLQWLIYLTSGLGAVAALCGFKSNGR